MREQYGADATVVKTTVVTSKGLQGFFAQRSFRATVEVSDATSVDAHAFDLPARAGIAALLDHADEHEAAERFADPAWAVSTASDDFAAILAGLRRTTAPIPDPAARAAVVAAARSIAAAAAPSALPAVSIAAVAPLARPIAPEPLRGPGDLVMVIGRGGDALRIAARLAGDGGCLLRVAGGPSAEGVGRVADRRDLTAARAEGVRAGTGIVVAYGLAGPEPDLAGLDADQRWLAVDAGRKHDDTAAWVRAVVAVAPATGVLAWGASATASPGTVELLGLPVRWVDAD